MSFFNPLNLLWLLPVAGLVILMYILRLRRRDVIVPSTFLWRQVIRDVQANAPFQKLRRNLLLFLQLAAVLLFALIVARPFWRSQGIGGRSVVIVVDASASMMAADVRPNRLEQAKQKALGIVNDMQPQDQMIVVRAAARPEAVSGFSSDRRELASAIRGIDARETSTNMRDALNLAAALVATRDAAQIDVVSDGGFAPIASVNLGKAQVRFHPVGESGANVGITALDYRHSLAGEQKLQVFVTLRNFDAKPRTATLEVAHRNDLLDAQEVTLRPGAEDSQVLELPELEAPLALDIRIDPDDYLAVDNRASLVITPRRTIRTLLVSSGNPFLERAIMADPNAELSRVDLAGFAGPNGFDVVVFDGAAPKTVPPGNYLYVNCASDRSPATPIGSAPNQSVVDADRSHPALRYVEFGRIHWTQMSHARPAAWAREIAGSETGPAIIAGETEGLRALWTGFNLDHTHSGFPGAVGYPIFVSNALRWLARSEETAETQARTGAPITLDAPPDAGQVTVTKPDGSRESVAVNPRGGAVFDAADQVGTYTASGPGGYRRVFAANLVDPAESDITPRPSQDLGGGPSVQPGRRVQVTWELWPWLAFGLLALLALEWYAFHRRAFVS